MILMNTLSSCRWTCKYTSLSPANWGKKQTRNYITHLMQKEPDSTGGFKDTTRLASDTRRSPPLSTFPLILNLQKKKEWMSEGRKITNILSICKYLAYENMKYLLHQGNTAGGICFTAILPRWGHRRSKYKTPSLFTSFRHWIIFPW